MKKHYERNASRLTVICLIILMLAATLAGCGSNSKGVDGYYICGKYALEIHGSTATLHYEPTGKSRVIEATVEKTDEGADLYFGKSSSVFLNDMNDYNPMHVKLSDNGENMYLSSDSEGWSADTYEVVSKEDFEAFIEAFLNP